jgi:hypothetical protein
MSSLSMWQKEGDAVGEGVSDLGDLSLSAA